MAKILFKINGKPYEADGKFSPDVSLNEYIRTVAELRGTKAMCHEGGCGVCVVAVRAALPPTNEVKLFSVNSCLVSVLSCHGWDVTTVEGIGSRMIGYHDIQSRLAKFNGTQCGYCTPGWVMNMYSIYDAKKNSLTMEDVENSFASNICRCTGYRPIADAFKTFANNADESLMNQLIDLEDLSNLKNCHQKCSKSCLNKNENEEEKSGTTKTRNPKTDEDWCVIEKSSINMIEIDCGRVSGGKIERFFDEISSVVFEVL